LAFHLAHCAVACRHSLEWASSQVQHETSGSFLDSGRNATFAQKVSPGSHSAGQICSPHPAAVLGCQAVTDVKEDILERLLPLRKRHLVQDEPGQIAYVALEEALGGGRDRVDKVGTAYALPHALRTDRTPRLELGQVQSNCARCDSEVIGKLLDGGPAPCLHGHQYPASRRTGKVPRVAHPSIPEQSIAQRLVFVN
jgi:hypothetical protein